MTPQAPRMTLTVTETTQQQAEQIPPVRNVTTTVGLFPPLADPFLLDEDDGLLGRLEWDMAPVVVEEFNLIFFTQAKVGCTVWKQLFRRIKQFKNWRAEFCCGLLPWNPKRNGLTYLYHYDRQTASNMLTSSNWTKAIFVRDPIERFVSAWLDKAVRDNSYVQQHCCKHYHLEQSLCDKTESSIDAFVELYHVCDNGHWRPQNQRMPDPSYWNVIDFVGRMETIGEDAERLLRQIGAWDEYGTNGWGTSGNLTIFQGGTGRSHATSAKSKIQKYVSTELEHMLRTELYREDFANPIFSRYNSVAE